MVQFTQTPTFSPLPFIYLPLNRFSSRNNIYAFHAKEIVGLNNRAKAWHAHERYFTIRTRNNYIARAYKTRLILHVNIRLALFNVANRIAIMRTTGVLSATFFPRWTRISDFRSVAMRINNTVCPGIMRRISCPLVVHEFW